MYSYSKNKINMTFYRDTNQKKSISFLPTGNNVETVVLLSKQKPDAYLDIEITAEEYERLVKR